MPPMGQGSEQPQQSDYFPDELPLYKPGHLVKHRQYGYRGVVVDFDMACQADDGWYEHNRTRPDRAQPWYHVLVDGATAVTYAAQENLKPDDEAQPVHHPLVPHFFKDFENGGYERNDSVWPGWGK